MSSKTITRIGPADQGRPMSLEEFEHAEAEEGQLYELSRGVVTMVDVPNPGRLAQVLAIRRQVHAYDAANPGRIHTIASGSECKLLISGLESERHPDVALYKTPPPEGGRGGDFPAEARGIASPRNPPVSPLRKRGIIGSPVPDVSYG